jgi:uncharacterized radical SAM superfamily Fe-S cluster-containing enzyme
MRYVIHFRQLEDWGKVSIDYHECIHYEVQGADEHGDIYERLVYHKTPGGRWIRERYEYDEDGLNPVFEEARPTDVVRDMLRHRRPIPPDLVPKPALPRWERREKGGVLWLGRTECTKCTNFVGEYTVLPKGTVRQLVRHELDMSSGVYEELASKHFVLDGDSSVALDLLAVKYRTKQSLLANFTSLFMYVVTLRCDHSCPYCQVSRQSVDRHSYDMKPEMAEKAIDFMFRSPSKSIKVEFQGGEPLLNFALIRQSMRLPGQ